MSVSSGCLTAAAPAHWERGNGSNRTRQPGNVATAQGAGLGPSPANEDKVLTHKAKKKKRKGEKKNL